MSQHTYDLKNLNSSFNQCFGFYKIAFRIKYLLFATNEKNQMKFPLKIRVVNKGGLVT